MQSRAATALDRCSPRQALFPPKAGEHADGVHRVIETSILLRLLEKEKRGADKGVKLCSLHSSVNGQLSLTTRTIRNCHVKLAAPRRDPMGWIGGMGS